MLPFNLFLYCCCLSIFVSFQNIKLFNLRALRCVKTDEAVDFLKLILVSKFV